MTARLCSDCKKPAPVLYACVMCGAQVCRECGTSIHVCPRK
jgi:hypothetical protein